MIHYTMTMCVITSPLLILSDGGSSELVVCFLGNVAHGFEIAVGPMMCSLPGVMTLYATL